MKLHLSPTTTFKKEAILKLIDGFDQAGEKVGTGDRNAIKNFKVDGTVLNVKSFKVPNLVNKIVYKFFRKSKAQRSCENALYLLKHDIGTPYPVAYLEEVKPLQFGKSYYVSEYIDADLTYRDLIRQPDYPERERIIRLFTAFTYRLHQNNILFKDHSPGNTLIKKIGDSYQFYLVDLNRMEFKELSFEERIINFTRLTSKQDMVQLMSDEYAKLTGENYEAIYALMWEKTALFQKKFYRKKHFKEKYFFWKS